MAPMTALNKVKAPIFKGRVSGVYGVAITNKDDPMVAAKHVTMAYQNTRKERKTKCSEMCIHVHPLQATINLKLQAYTLHKNIHVASILQCTSNKVHSESPSKTIVHTVTTKYHYNNKYCSSKIKV